MKLKGMLCHKIDRFAEVNQNRTLRCAVYKYILLLLLLRHILRCPYQRIAQRHRTIVKTMCSSNKIIRL